MRLVPILATLLLAPAARGQILSVELKDVEKVEAKLERHLTLIAGRRVILGEAKKGITLRFEERKIAYAQTIELWIPNSANPAAVPYRRDAKGQLLVADRKGVLEIATKDIADIRFHELDQSLQGLAREYLSRKAEEERLAKARDACARGSREWFVAHQRLLAHLERLLSFLRSRAFSEAAEALEKDLERQRRAVAGESQAERLAAARASVRMLDTPEALVQAAQETSGGKLQFHVQESLHVRIVHLVELEDERVREALVFAEEALDGFRRDCVDPYASDSFPDWIPDRPFLEVFFGPMDDTASYERLLPACYRLEWGEHKAEQIKASGTRFVRTLPPEHLSYRKLEPDLDLLGVVAHLLGHALANVHYDQNRTGMRQDWLGEAVGYYVSLEHLGRNNVTCYSFDAESREGTHVKVPKTSEGTHVELRAGLRPHYNELAVENKNSLERLAQLALVDMRAADCAKAWSAYDYLVKRCGLQGQQLLRDACQHARAPQTFVQNWKLAAGVLFGLPGTDVLLILEERWRGYAKTEQVAPEGR